MLGGLVGCQVPPARVAGCDDSGLSECRTLSLTRQIAADSAIALAQHPLRTVRVTGSESIDALAARGRSILGKRLFLHFLCRPGPVCPCRPMADGAALEACLLHQTGEPLQPAGVQLQTTGPEALDSLLNLIDRATCRIDVIMFMWDDTALGLTIAQHLAARAGPNLPVRVLVDGAGNAVFGKLSAVNHAVCWLASQPYVQLIRIRDPGTRLDHRKLVVVDGSIAWTGGRNFTEGGFLKRHDVSLTFTGPLVVETERRFESFWEDQGGPPFCVPCSSLATDCALPESEANAVARLVYTEPGDHVLEHALYTAVDRAMHHVYLENPYLTDGGLLVKLARARRRGADVRVVLSISTDTPAINHASRVTANRLLRAGVRVYLYPGWTHAKAAAVDGCWAYLGTGNFDPRSLRENHEIGLAISGGALLDEIEQRVFRPDFRPEWELHSPLHVTPCDYFYELLGGLCL